MKITAAFVTLCTVLSISEATSSFKILRTTCDHVYGIPLGVYSESDLIQCSRRCSQYGGGCNSILYNPVSKLCMLNQDVQRNEESFPDDCGFQYAVRMIHFSGCQSEWTAGGSLCYKFISKCMSWHQCKAECEGHGVGAMLARMFNDSSNQNLDETVRPIIDTAWNQNDGGPCQWECPWAGVHDLVTPDVLMDAMFVQYPSDFVMYPDQWGDCGMVDGWVTWLDECSYPTSCLCQMEPDTAISHYGSM